MKKLAPLALALGCAFSAPALAQPYQNEVSVFGSWDNANKPANTDLISLSARYGRFMSPRVVAQGTVSYNRFEADGQPTSHTGQVLVGAKYYFSEIRAQSLVPFADVGVGIADTETGSTSSTDFAWEIGGGASMFLDERTSIDTALRLYHINTDSASQGVRLSIGLTTRF